MNHDQVEILEEELEIVIGRVGVGLPTIPWNATMKRCN